MQCVQFFFFFCGEFWMSRLLLQGRETIHSLAHRRTSSNGVVWWCAFEQETITELGRTVLTHRSCSLGFPPLWGPKKDVIRGKMFGSDDSVTEEVGKLLRIQNLKWYKRGLEAPVLCNGAQIFLICLLLFSTCFGQLCAHHQEKIPYLCDTWYLSLYMGECLVCRAERPAYQTVIYTEWQIPGVA